MPIYLNSNSGSLIEFQDGLPVNYSGPLLRDSKAIYFAKDTCQLIIQEIITELYTLHLNVFRFFETLTFDSVSNKEGIHSRILLKGNLRHKVKGTGKIYLREGEFTMLWADSANCKCRFEKDTEYRTLDIFYSPALFQQLIIYFPELKDLQNAGHLKQLIKNPCYITPAMRNIRVPF